MVHNPLVTIENNVITAWSSASGTIIIPANATSMSAGLFENNTNITSVTFRNTFTAIPNNSFKGCTGLQSVTFTATSSVASTGDNAFEGCNNASFTSIEIQQVLQL